jgi:phosphopantetheinyl transferase (holo-ACP synthase)
MLGNDLIDLKKAAIESNWQRKGYLDKLFSKEEKHQILSSENPFLQVWLFWSMKEAVYKIINRETGLRFYSPSAFTCKNNVQGRANKGEVYYNGKIYYTLSRITNAMIHTIALQRNQDFCAVDVLYLANTPGYIKAFNSTSNTYNLTKNEHGIPELIHRTIGTKHVASVSHHGKFLAIVSLKTDA